MAVFNNLNRFDKMRILKIFILRLKINAETFALKIKRHCFSSTGGNANKRSNVLRIALIAD